MYTRDQSIPTSQLEVGVGRSPRLLVSLIYPFPTLTHLNFHVFRPFFSGASQHLWSWIPNASPFQEHPRPSSPNSKGCSPRPRDGREQQHRLPSSSAAKRAWRRLAEPYGRRGRKPNVRGLQHVDQGPTSYHGGPYCHHSCNVW